MPVSPDWGWNWTIAAYVVSWAAYLGYARYLAARSHAAWDAVQRESHRESQRESQRAGGAS